MNSMKIGTYQMDTTFGLYLPEYTIPAPAVQTNFVKIIGRDGSVDLSNALGLHYDSRTWSLDFKCFDPTVNWHTLSSQVMNAIHGKRLNFEFDDDPNYFWTGRVSVQNYVSNHGTGTLKVTIVSDPFKYAKLSTIVTKTASTGTDYTGSMVTFNDGLIYDLSADIEPIQDLHGYANPWPAGGGKNKLLIQDKDGGGITGGYNSAGEYVITGTAGNAAVYCDFTSVTLPAGSYVFSISTLPTGLNAVYTKNGAWAGIVTDGKVITLTEEASIGGYISIAANTEVNISVKIQLEAGSTKTAWTPYSNICPISGRTGLSVYRTGKNLIKIPETVDITKNGIHFVSSDDGIKISETSTGVYPQTYAIAFKSLLPVGAEVTISQKLTGTVPSGAHVYFILREYDGSTLTEHSLRNAASLTFSISKPLQALTIVAEGNGITYDNLLAQFQVEEGTSATDYAPYNGNTYAVDWTSEAGTVYGGTLDVVTGVLTSTHKLIHLDGSTNKAEGVYGNGTIYTNIITGMYNDASASRQYETLVKSDTLKGTSSTSIANTPYGVSQNTGQRLVLNLPNISTTADANAWLVANETHVLIELATPLTYQLTPQEVEALVGTNNVWSDGGNVTVAVVTPETLTNNGRAVVPTLTASADMVLKWGNYSASVQQGTSTIPQLILENGANLIYIIGTGSISFTWQEVSL